MAELARALADLRAADGQAFGGKSSALGELIAAGIPVPPGFAVSTGAYRAFVDAAGLGRMIESAMAQLSPDDVDTVGAASHRISEAMRSAPVPEAVREEVSRRYSELGEPPVAVRSSALGEDSQEATFAPDPPPCIVTLAGVSPPFASGNAARATASVIRSPTTTTPSSRAACSRARSRTACPSGWSS